MRPLATRLVDEGVKPLVVLRYTLYVTEQLAGAATALQERLIWFEEVAVAVRLVGAAGTVVQLGPWSRGGYGGDRINVFRLIAIDFGGLELPVRRERGAITTWQKDVPVNDQQRPRAPAAQ